jgi:hypothetical protein
VPASHARGKRVNAPTPSGRGKSIFPSDAEALEQDAGQTIGFVRAVARRTEAEAVNLYEANLAAKFGVE